MKKLKLYGKKDAIRVCIGYILVKGNKLAVEAEEADVKSDLEKALQTLPRDYEGNVFIQVGEVKITVNHPKFLNLLMRMDFLTRNKETFEYPKFGEYELESHFSKVVTVIGEGKVEKLKLFAEKDETKGFLASIYVMDKKVVIESEDAELRECLSAEISKRLEERGGFRLCWSTWERRPDGTVIHTDGFKLQKPSDSHFLDALRNEFYETVGFGARGVFGNQRFCGYKINPTLSELVEE